MVVNPLVALVLAAQAPSAQGPVVLESAPPVQAPLWVETYPSEEAQTHANVFSLEIGSEGRVVVGHGLGLSAFDGVSWNASAQSVGLVAHLLRSPLGEIYVGSSRGVGRLVFEPDGAPAVDWLEPKAWAERSPGMVKFIATSDDRTIYAGGDEFVFCCRPGAGADTWVEVEPDQEDQRITHVFALRGDCYVALPRVGIRRLEDGQTTPLANTESLRGMDVQAVLPTGDEDALVFTADHGIHIWSPVGTSSWESELTTALEGHRLYNASRLASGGFSVSSSRGVLIAGPEGELLSILNESTGLTSNASFGRAVEDEGGGLWAGTFGGVSRIQLRSPVAVFGDEQGIGSSVFDIESFEGRHYVATHDGLLGSDPDPEPGAPTTFVRIPGVEGAAWDLLQHRDALWVASSTGVYRIFEGEAYLTGASKDSTALVAADDDHIFAAGPGHLARIDIRNPGHTQPDTWRTVLQSVRGMHVDAEGRLWIPGMTERRAWKIFRMDFRTAPVQGDFLDAEDGVPSQPLSLTQVGNDLLLGFPRGLARYDSHTGRFTPEHTLQSALAKYGGGALNLTEGPSGDLWFWNAENRTVRATHRNGEWKLSDPLRSAELENALCFASTPDGRLWIGSSDGQLALFDPAVESDFTLPAPRVRVLAEGIEGRTPVEGPALASLSAGEASLRFQYGWTSFERVSGNRFRSRLIGLGGRWSPWSSETYRDFPGLREGDYELQVEARTAGGHLSPVARVAFQVLPPWYRTPWAYGALAASIALAMLALAGLRSAAARGRIRSLTRELDEKRVTEEAQRIKEAQLEQEINELGRAAAGREQHGQQTHEAQKLEAVGRLAAGVAHDFNNILTVIHGEAELGHASATLAGAGLSQKFAAIQDASERGAHLTRQLLEFSGNQPQRPRVIALGQTLMDTRTLLERVVLDDVALELNIDSDLRPVEIDPVQFERVMMNLVVNASEAMPLGGKIRVSASNLDAGQGHGLQGPCVRLVVEDNGMGMDADTLATAFEPFFSTKGPGRVSGLGLATVHGIVKQAGGHVTLQSESGAGTRAEILLPVATRLEVPAPPMPDVLRPAPQGTTVLVCDSDVQVRRVTAQLLERAGYQVISADSPDEALRRARTHNGRIDVLVTDVVMPGLNGPELATQLAQTRPALRVVYLSGYPSEVLAPRGILAPDIRFVAKPYSTQRLLDSIAAALGSPPPHTSIQSHAE